MTPSNPQTQTPHGSRCWLPDATDCFKMLLGITKPFIAGLKLFTVTVLTAGVTWLSRTLGLELTAICPSLCLSTHTSDPPLLPSSNQTLSFCSWILLQASLRSSWTVFGSETNTASESSRASRDWTCCQNKQSNSDPRGWLTWCVDKHCAPVAWITFCPNLFMKRNRIYLRQAGSLTKCLIHTGRTDSQDTT